MSVFKLLVAIYMLVVAVAAHFLVTQFYDPMLEDTALTVWRVLDPLMVIGVAAALIAAFARKRALDADGVEQPVSREYLSANVTFATRLYSSLCFSITGSAWSLPISVTTRGWYGF